MYFHPPQTARSRINGNRNMGTHNFLHRTRSAFEKIPEYVTLTHNMFSVIKRQGANRLSLIQIPQITGLIAFAAFRRANTAAVSRKFMRTT
jgi:lipopolysaccharide biosynthesis protein